MATLTTERPTADYTCSQAELYSGLKTAWDSQAEREAEFIAENTKYTAGLSVTKKQAIDAAKALPDGQARYAESEVMRADLEEIWDGCMGKWNSLDGYIKKAFKGTHYKPRIEEAGKGYYQTAANKDWEDLSELLQAGKNFITEHSAVLISDGGMPATFPDAYDDVRDDFEELYEDFKDARQDAQEQTDAKILANNAIYADGRDMMDDGKHIFRKNASVRERFIWERILAMLTPETGGGSGISAVREGEILVGQIVVINLDGIATTPLSKVITEVTASGLRLYFSATPNEIPGPTTVFWDVSSTQTIEKTEAEFKELTGWSPTKPHLNGQNIGMVTTEYKLTFTNLEEEEE